MQEQRATATRNLTTGQSPVYYNSTTFIAPQQLRNDFSLNYVDISFRWRKFFRERSLGLECTVESAIHRLDLISGFTHAAGLRSFRQLWTARRRCPDLARASKYQPACAHVRFRFVFGHRYPGFGAIRAVRRPERSATIWRCVRVTPNGSIDGDAGHAESNFQSTFSGPMLDLGWNF